MMLAFCTFAHMCFFVISLAFVGFEAMIFALLLGTWSYSCYLTLREWSVGLYILFSLATAFYLLYAGAGFDAESTQVVGLLANSGFDVCAAYYTARAYYYFRKTGGIHGLGGVKELPEEKMLAQAATLAAKGADKIDGALEKEAIKEKNADLEAAAVDKAINS